MRFATVLLVVAVLLFGFQFLYFRSKTDRIFDRAVRDLPHDPERAYNQFKPAFDVSNALTLGKAAAMQERFFARAAEKVKDALAQPALERDFFFAVEKNVRIMAEAEEEYGLDLDPYQSEIAEALRDAEDNIRETVTLAAWDAYVSRIDAMAESGLLPPEPFPGFEQWRRDLHQVDRRAIGLREALTVASAQFEEMIRALGFEPSTRPTDPFVAPLDPVPSSHRLLEAEHAVAAGKQRCEWFVKTFREPDQPPELKPIYGKLLYNSATMKIAHMMNFGRNEPAGMSPYIVGLFLGPGSGAIPSDAELRALFVGAAWASLEAAVEIFQSPDGAPPGQSQALLGLSAYNMLQFARFENDSRRAGAAESAYIRYRNTADPSPLNNEVFSHLRAGSPPCIVLK